MPVRLGHLDPASEGGSGFVVPAQPAQRISESAPRIALVVGGFQIGLQLGHGLVEAILLEVLQCQAEAKPGVIRAALQQAHQGVGAIGHPEREAVREVEGSRPKRRRLTA